MKLLKIAPVIIVLILQGAAFSETNHDKKKIFTVVAIKNVYINEDSDQCPICNEKSTRISTKEKEIYGKSYKCQSCGWIWTLVKYEKKSGGSK